MDVTIDRVDVSAYCVPTDFPESDGTLEWDATTLVLVRLHGGGKTGLGYTYNGTGAAMVIHEKLAVLLRGGNALDIGGHWAAMNAAVRNLGQPGIAAAAIAAVDIALWDLKARLLDLPLVKLLGAVRATVPAYGSGGFTSYPPEMLSAQMQNWVREGFSLVKMKVGREPDQDVARVRSVRAVIGPEAGLLVDANGAYARKEALQKAAEFAALGVSWFEEPVSSDDLEGLRLLRDRAPAKIEVAAGEYGSDTGYFRHMLAAGAVDVLQADVTRCGGISGFLRVGALGAAFQVPLSAHTAPSVHQHPCCALENVRHVEYFHDHTRIEQLFFEGAARAEHGLLRPDLTRPGLGLEFKEPAAAPYLVWP